MSIPKYSGYGFVPPGTHSITLAALDVEVTKLAGRRGEIWTKYKEFELKAQTSMLFSDIFFFGSFFSVKSKPSDIDIALSFKGISKPECRDLWIFDQSNVKRTYLTDVLFIEPKNSSYKESLPAGLKFLSPKLTMCRVFSPEEEKEWATKLKAFPQDLHGKEYKGVLVAAI